MRLKKLAATKKTTKKTTKSTAKKGAKSKAAKKPAFGGYAITFAGRTETLEKVFGKKPIAPSDMTKKIWAFIKSNNLSNR